MKKILILICIIFSINSFSQSRLDTVYVRNLQLKGEEWWWGIDGINPFSLDSALKFQYKKLIRAIETADPTSAQNTTIDSVPGVLAMMILEDYWSRPEAREHMGQGIDTKLRAYAPLSPYISTLDAQRFARFDARKSRGRQTVKKL